MNIDDMTVGELKNLVKMFQGSGDEESPMIGRHCVVRTYSAGVWLGTVIKKKGANVVLAHARRLWKWKGAFTLSEVALYGVDNEGSRIAVEVPEVELTQAIELIPTTSSAQKKFEVINE